LTVVALLSRKYGRISRADVNQNRKHSFERLFDLLGRRRFKRTDQPNRVIDDASDAAEFSKTSAIAFLIESGSVTSDRKVSRIGDLMQDLHAFRACASFSRDAPFFGLKKFGGFPFPIPLEAR